MSRNPELDRLKAEQQSLFEQKQAAFQRFKDLQKRTNIAHDVMQSAWGAVRTECKGRSSWRRHNPFFLWHNKTMYLSNDERKEIMFAYGCEDFTEINHYEVGPDTWIYLFEHDDKKYLLVTTDYLGDYEFDVFPHLLRYDDASNKIDFVLQREIPAKNNSLLEKARINTILFEYTN